MPDSPIAEARKALKATRKRRPLTGIEALTPDKRVLVVSSAALEAARTLFGPRFTCLSWTGGVATTDWEPLYGRSVDLWPDASNQGDMLVAGIVEILLPRLADPGQELRVMMQEERRDGWNLSNALEEGWDMARVAAHAKRDNEKHIRVLKGGPRQELQVGRPHDGKAAIEPEPEPGQDRSAQLWWQDLGLICNGGGPLATEYNALLVLSKHPDFAGKLWVNDFSHKLMFEDHVFQRESDAVRILIHMQQYLAWGKLPMQAIERAAVVVGSANARHPVREWLKGLTWDGIDRLDTFMADAFGARQNEYTRAVGRCWLVSMVARVMEPGCQADCLVVLEGAQGVRKSSALRQLGGEWFTESHADPIHDRKEFLQGLQGRWLIEIPEMHTIAGRNSIEKIKGTISNRVDSFRVPYGHDVADFPRQCIFAGSTNADAWNPDSTGGRRFWPITCGAINVDYIELNRAQLFAEAVRWYETEHTWWDVPDTEAKEEQEARRETDPWEEIIDSYVSHRSEITVADILEGLLEIKAGDWNQGYKNRVAKCLHSLGWRRHKAYVTGGRKWLYRPSTTLQRSLKETGEF
jgi:predicted P-loop ATPase